MRTTSPDKVPSRRLFPIMTLKIGPTKIEDTFAEAFRMVFCRLTVTAADDHWLNAAIHSTCGYGTSVIGCDAEVGLERRIPADQTPDGRPGADLLLFGFSQAGLEKAVVNRVGQCLMTCPSTAVFDGLPQAAERIAVGNPLRFFGDGFQQSKQIGDQRFWRVPVMDGEFLVADTVGMAKGIAGGNFLILAVDQATGLHALRRALENIALVPEVITPFPGGAVRSGSKVGSRYPKLRASTNHHFCPTLRSQVESWLPDEVQAVYEIVIDGCHEGAIAHAMAVGIRAAAGAGIVAISAGNYGGNLGKFHFRLHDVLKQT